MELRGTTIIAVRKDGKTAVAGDGQVTMSESVIMKATAKKVRRLYHDQVVVGFAGSVADAFSLCERFEKKLEQYSGNLTRAAVSLAQDWRSDKIMHKLEALLIVANKEELLIVSGTGEVIDPDAEAASAADDQTAIHPAKQRVADLLHGAGQQRMAQFSRVQTAMRCADTTNRFDDRLARMRQAEAFTGLERNVLAAVLFGDPDFAVHAAHFAADRSGQRHRLARRQIKLQIRRLV